MTKIGLGVAGALVVAMVSVHPATARDGWSPGAAAAVGVLGGLAAGAAIGSAAREPGYYPGRPVEYAPPPPPPGYYPPPPRRVIYEESAPECYVRTRRFVNEWGDTVIRRQRVCD